MDEATTKEALINQEGQKQIPDWIMNVEEFNNNACMINGD